MDLFDQEDGKNDNRPLAERMRPRTLDEYVGQGHLLGSGQPHQAGRRGGPPLFGDLLGAARFGENDARPHHGTGDEIPLHQLLSRPLRGEGDPRRRRGGDRAVAPSPPQDGPLRGRDPPLQQGPAGCLSPPRGERTHHPHRGHDGESLFRSDCPAPLPDARPDPEIFHGRRSRPDRPECPGRQRAGTGKTGPLDRPRGAGSISSGRPTGTPVPP